MSIRKINFQMLIGLAVGALLGVAATALAPEWNSWTAASDEGRELHAGPKDFINPLIDCAQMPERRTLKKSPLQAKLGKLIDRLQDGRMVEKISLSFRDLMNGTVLRINGEEPFMAASLLKVPIVIALMKKAQKEADLLNKRMIYNASGNRPFNWVQSEVPNDPMTPGSTYSIEDLIRRMVMQSDNAAATMLLQETPPQEVVQMLREMGVPLVQKNNEWWITVTDYGSIFRILYNATYLPDSMSNNLLKMLSQAQFKNGLVAGVPSGTTVAHKFGERKIGASQQFHDCGIVYHERPYLLCIMTRGSNLTKLESAIRDVSKAVFEHVSAN